MVKAGHFSKPVSPSSPTSEILTARSVTVASGGSFRRWASPTFVSDRYRWVRFLSPAMASNPSVGIWDWFTSNLCRPAMRPTARRWSGVTATFASWRWRSDADRSSSASPFAVTDVRSGPGLTLRWSNLGIAANSVNAASESLMCPTLTVRSSGWPASAANVRSVTPGCHPRNSHRSFGSFTRSAAASSVTLGHPERSRCRSPSRPGRCALKSASVTVALSRRTNMPTSNSGGSGSL